MQASLLPVVIEHEFDSTFEGNDLKRLGRGDDGHTYALKRLVDHATLPICEWVGYHLCRATGVRTPDFSVVQFSDGQPPAFGSRIFDAKRQVAKNPGNYEIAAFFGGHLAAAASIYALDVFITNSDRHGRNVMVADLPGGSALWAFDFSRAWVRLGMPFGNTDALRDSHTQKWWKTFKRLGATPDLEVLERVASLGDGWLDRVFSAAPGQWTAAIDCPAVLGYWRRRSERIDFAKLWL